MRELAERLCDLPEHLPGSSGPLEALLTGLLHQGARRSRAGRSGDASFPSKQKLSVAECAGRSVGSKRAAALAGLSGEYVEIALKMWCRIRRFQATVQALHRGGRRALGGLGACLWLLRPYGYIFCLTLRPSPELIRPPTPHIEGHGKITFFLLSSDSSKAKPSNQVAECQP